MFVSSFHFYILIAYFLSDKMLLQTKLLFANWRRLARQFSVLSETIQSYIILKFSILYHRCLNMSQRFFVQPCTCTFVQVHFKYEPVNNHLIDNSLNSLCRSNNSIKPQAPDIIYFSHNKYAPHDKYAPSTYNNNCILIGRAYIFFIMRKIYCIIR